MHGVATTSNQVGKIPESVTDLLSYCKKNEWSGFDPYDALNSRLYAATPFYDSRICGIALTQIMKRLPIDLRPLLLVPKEQNPKAIALFLAALLKLSRLGLLDQKDLIGRMIERLMALRSPDTPYWCWGYNFPWQTRTIRVPRWAPNLVCTSFVASALLDAYEENREPRCLSMAASAAEYILNELYWADGNTIAGFSYPLPSSRGKVHNANFLGAALLCRIYKHSGDTKFLEPALKVARYSAAWQHDNGSWDYGESSTQHWVDNFHTGYNLCALRAICHYTGITEFEPNIRRGFEFYQHHFFRKDGAPKYFHDRTYPIDIHSVAQSIITLLTLKDLDEGSVKLARSVFDWATNHMRDEQGYFYYRVLPYYKNKISYMRWSQAWMLLALSTLLEKCFLGVDTTHERSNVMQSGDKFRKAQRLHSWQEEMDTIDKHIRDKASNGRALDILEAGCGRRWGLGLKGVQFTLTGVDRDKNALDVRKNQNGDLDIAIQGDLRSVDLEKDRYDVIFNSNVLEHVDGAEDVLNNFVSWLKPGGMLILIIPNRNSARGFVTRVTPFWLHIFHEKYIKGFKHAGKPGYDPYPTYFDKVVSRRGIHEYCEKHGLVIKAEYCAGHGRKVKRIFQILSTMIIWIVHLVSFRRLSIEYANIIFVIECDKVA